MCAPLNAHFDRNYVHIFLAQSITGKQKDLEQSSIERLLLGSHNGNLNLQLAANVSLSLQIILKK